MFKKKLLALIFLFPNILLSSNLSYQTTRLKSTGGAGVASILLDEATFLNPAPLAFFNLTSVLIQRTGGQEKINNQGDVDSENYMAVISDSKGSIKGSFSYLKSSQQEVKGTSYAASLAFPLKQTSSIGTTFRRSTTKIKNQEETKNQYILGASHNISPNFSLGAILVDPLSKEKNNSFAIFGAQIVYGDFISLMLDIGANYNFPLDESLLYKTAVQIMFFTDVYLRAGYFYDRGLKDKGTGVGIGWVQPRLAVEAALKNSKDFFSTKTNRETSFSLSYRF